MKKLMILLNYKKLLKSMRNLSKNVVILESKNINANKEVAYGMKLIKIFALKLIIPNIQIILQKFIMNNS